MIRSSRPARLYLGVMALLCLGLLLPNSVSDQSYFLILIIGAPASWFAVIVTYAVTVALFGLTDAGLTEAVIVRVMLTGLVFLGAFAQAKSVLAIVGSRRALKQL